MKYKLGISVYPDIKPIEEIKEYIKLASKYGFTKIFSSMFSVPGTNEEVLGYFRELIEFAHQYDMEVDLDVSPELFDRLGATSSDLSIFKSIDVDIIRMDLSYGKEKDRELVENDLGIKIEFNSEPHIVKGLVEAGAKAEDILVCYNFYPQKYTGFGWDEFRRNAGEIKSYGDVTIGAFVSSNNTETHGVWDSKDGLPTIERLRGLPIDLQARILIASGLVNEIIIGNAFATEEEMKSLKEVLDNAGVNKDLPIIKLLIENGIYDEKSMRSIIFKPEISPYASESEKEILFNFETHMSSEANNEFIWRSRISRSRKDFEYKPRSCEKEFFQRGDILIVNDNYRYYAGEVQIVLGQVENDGQRNYVGRVTEDEMMLVDLLDRGLSIKFLK